ncbi:MAG: SCO family protein [Pseudomonadota bacterium]|nr:SCO family protein [Pseudomonadota bacterium]
MSRLPWIIVLMAVAAGFGLWLGLRGGDADRAAPKFQSLLAYGAPRSLTDFDLEASDGGRLDFARLRGRYSVLFFGFINCPDVCPTAMATLAEVDQQLSNVPKGARPNYVFVSVDPARDTAQAAGAYAQHFSTRILGATATDARLEPFTRQLGVLYAAQPAVDGVYNVDHSAHFVILDPEVRVIGIIRPPHVASAIAADLLQLIGNR